MSGTTMHAFRSDRVGVVTAPSVRRGALLLSAVVAVLLLVASLAGLLVEGLYRESGSASSMFRGYDLVSLVFVVPGLAVALIGVRRGSTVAEPVWVGLLAATVYTYAFYVLGTAFNDLLLLHVATFSASMFALILALASVDLTAIRPRIPGKARVRIISAILALLAVGLGGMWIVASLQFAWSGKIPDGSALVETDSLVHLGIALDLALLVPSYAAAAVLLWRLQPWGYLLAAVVLVSGVVHQIGYIVAMPFQLQSAVPGAVAYDPAEPVIAGLFLVGTALLLTPSSKGGHDHAPR